MTDSKPEGYAVQFYFDSDTEKQIFKFRDSIYQQGLTPVLGKMGDRPHVTLAVMPLENLDCIQRIVRDFASTLTSFPFELAAVGTFPSKENVLFLLPIPSIQLIKTHKAFHRILKKESIKPSPYYLPDHWVPHCTLEFELPDDQLDLALHLCKKQFVPMRGRLVKLGIVAFRPIEYIAEHSLVL